MGLTTEDSKMEPTSFVRSPQAVTRIIAGETLVVPVRQNVGDLSSIFVLNACATTVWAGLDEPATVDELTRRVTSAFEVDEAEARRDVVELLASLSSIGLVQARGQPPAEAPPVEVK
jgi:hypothetical protein